jgi:hypothetical protein
MFGMVYGGLPRITAGGVDLDALEAAVAAGEDDPAVLRTAIDGCVAEWVAVQVEAGLELVTDGQVRWPDLGAAVRSWIDDHAAAARPGRLADAWRSTAALTDRPVAQALPGPYSLGGRVPAGTARRLPATRRRERTLELADALAAELRALADAGCPLVVVEEPDATRIGTNTAERRLFADAHRRLLAPVPDLHVMLAIWGADATDAGAETIFAAPYRSHLFDLIDGPDNWSLVRAAPPERGIVCAAHKAGPGTPSDQAPELVWAAGYAASTGARGLARVGLANAAPMRALSRDEALAGIRGIGRAASLAGLPPDEAIAAGLDPRTFANRRTPRARRPRPGAGSG